MPDSELSPSTLHIEVGANPTSTSNLDLDLGLRNLLLIGAAKSTNPSNSLNLNPSLTPKETYNGGYTSARTVKLRLANGGAGQAGLIGAFADAFIKWRVEEFHEDAFLVEWYLGDTTQSLSYLALGYVDVSFTYNEAAELAEMRSGKAVRRELVFVDHFYLVGPPSNPANLNPGNDSVEDMFNKIVKGGNEDVILPPSTRPPTRFLSRFDKSATNIKESHLFTTIGQVPWALTYSPWYHQYPRFPIEALAAASVLSEYTLTDRGVWLSSDVGVVEGLVVYAVGAGEGECPENPKNLKRMGLGSGASMAVSSTPKLLNPCSALLACTPQDSTIAGIFMDWLVMVDGGQEVVRGFKKNGEVLYTPAVKA